jgi:hypothetical protein
MSRTYGTAAGRVSSIPAWWRLLPTDSRGEGKNHVDKEDHHPRSQNVGPDRLDEVPAREGVRVIGDASGHSGQPHEMHREEQDVGTYER